MFSVQVKPDHKPYQVPPRCVAYALQKPFKEELEWLQQHDIITPPGMDETAEWCNNFVLVPKSNGKVRLCLDPAWINQALIRLVHRWPKLNDILHKLNKAQYLSLIDVSSGYLTLKLNKDKCHFRWISVSFLVKSYPGMMWNQTHEKWKHLQRCHLQKQKKELQVFLGMINYLSQFFPNTAGICESVRQQTSSKTEWTWNSA